MNCNNYEDKIISYIENELTSEERAQFKSELDNNPDLKESNKDAEDKLDNGSNVEFLQEKLKIIHE